MFFKECGHLASKFPGLQKTIQSIDEALSKMKVSSLVIPELLSKKLTLRHSQVSSILAQLTDDGLLCRIDMLECEKCRTFTDKATFEYAIVNKEPCECSYCDEDLTKQEIAYKVLYRLNKANNDAPKCTRNEVFISYCHEEKTWLSMLQTHLKPYVRNSDVIYWDDTHIQTGQKWKEEIASALDRAKVAVLLVSPGFLASDFIADNELPRLLKAQKDEGLIVCWIPITASAYKQTEIADFQAVRACDPAHPIDSLDKSTCNQVFVSICEEIQECLIR
jgi:hypothetical protein